MRVVVMMMMIDLFKKKIRAKSKIRIFLRSQVQYGTKVQWTTIQENAIIGVVSHVLHDTVHTNIEYVKKHSSSSSYALQDPDHEKMQSF
jgi:hypothetical protein